MATPDEPQHPFWRAWMDEGAQAQRADGSLIGRLLASAPPVQAPAPAPVQAPTGPELVIDLSEVLVPAAVEHGDPVVHFVRVAPPRSEPHLVSLPVDHRKNERVVRLHEPHLDRSLTENDRFEHWRRWMVASMRKDFA